MKKQPKEETKKTVNITVHIPISKELDSWLSEEARKEERSKMGMIRYILNEYKRKVEENGNQSKHNN